MNPEEESSKRGKRLRLHRDGSIESNTSANSTTKQAACQPKPQNITENESKTESNERERKNTDDQDTGSSVSEERSLKPMQNRKVVLEQIDVDDDEKLLSSVPKTRSRKKSTLTEENLAAFLLPASYRTTQSGIISSEEIALTEAATLSLGVTRKNSTAIDDKGVNELVIKSECEETDRLSPEVVISTLGGAKSPFVNHDEEAMSLEDEQGSTPTVVETTVDKTVTVHPANTTSLRLMQALPRNAKTTTSQPKQEEQIALKTLNTSEGRANVNQLPVAVKTATNRPLQDKENAYPALAFKTYLEKSANESIGDIDTNQTLQIDPISMHIDMNASNLRQSSSQHQTQASMAAQSTASKSNEISFVASNEFASFELVNSKSARNSVKSAEIESTTSSETNNNENKPYKERSTDDPLNAINLTAILNRCEAERRAKSPPIDTNEGAHGGQNTLPLKGHNETESHTSSIAGEKRAKSPPIDTNEGAHGGQNTSPKQENKDVNASQNIGRELEQLIPEDTVGINAQSVNDDEFEVVEILAWRRCDNVEREFMVRWEDYPSFDEWVAENDMNCAEILESFLAKNPAEYEENDSESASVDSTDGETNDEVEARGSSIARKLECIVCQKEITILLAPGMPRMRAFVCSNECATKDK